MNTRNLLLAVLIVGFVSCTTAYKAGQMPDDVYHSPGQERSGYVAVQTDQDRSAYRSNGNDRYASDDDSYLRMRVRNRRWSAFDDVYFNNWQYNTWGGGFNNWYNPFWSSWSWNSYYFNPHFSPFYWNNYYYDPGYYYNPIVIGKPIRTNPRANGPRYVNLNNYGSRTVTNPYSDPKGLGAGNTNNGRAPVRVFGNRNNENNGYAPRNNSSVPSRSVEPRGSSNSGSSNRGSSSGGTAPVRTFPRGGR